MRVSSHHFFCNLRDNLIHGKQLLLLSDGCMHHHLQKHIPQLLGNMPGISLGHGFLQLRQLLVDFVPDRLRRLPVKTGLCRLALQLLGCHQGRQILRHPVQQGFSLLLLLFLHSLPADEGGTGISCLHIPEHMGMAAHQLFRDALHHILHGELPCFLRHAGMEDHLHEKIPQLLAQKVIILQVDSLKHLIGFLDEVPADALVGLGNIPRAAPRLPQCLDNILQWRDVKLRLFGIRPDVEAGEIINIRLPVQLVERNLPDALIRHAQLVDIGDRILVRQHLHQAQLGIGGNLPVVHLGYHQPGRHIHRQAGKILRIDNRQPVNRVNAQLAVEHLHKAHARQDVKLHLICPAGKPCRLFPQQHHGLFRHHRAPGHGIDDIYARLRLGNKVIGNPLIKMGKILRFLIEAVIGGKADAPLCQHGHGRVLCCPQIEIFCSLHQLPAFHCNVAKITGPQPYNLYASHKILLKYSL